MKTNFKQSGVTYSKYEGWFALTNARKTMQNDDDNLYFLYNTLLKDYNELLISN